MKHKKILGMLLIILGVLVLLVIIYFCLGKETKASIIFGSKECNKIIEVMTTEFTERRCIICLNKFNGSSSETICSKCSSELNRCSVCGGKRTKIEMLTK